MDQAKRDAARIAWHERRQIDLDRQGNVLDWAFLDGYDAGCAASSAEWIPTIERLPEVGQAVWVTHRNRGDVRDRVFDTPYFAEEFTEMFSAWMPRQTEPDPYTPKEKNQ